MKVKFEKLSKPDKVEVRKLWFHFLFQWGKFEFTNYFLERENPEIEIFYKPKRFNIVGINILISKFIEENERPLFSE